MMVDLTNPTETDEMIVDQFPLHSIQITLFSILT